VLIGSGNPEEGELRPQLLDRFGLSVEVRTPTELAERVEVIKRRDEFERDRGAFIEAWRGADDKLRRRIVAARKLLPAMAADDAILEKAAALCMQLGTDGLRAELTMIRAARALASFEGARSVEVAHLRRIAPLALRHRLRRDPLDESDATARVERAVAESLAP
jgi:magnesium chelatase subunit I